MSWILSMGIKLSTIFEFKYWLLERTHHQFGGALSSETSFDQWKKPFPIQIEDIRVCTIQEIAFLAPQFLGKCFLPENASISQHTKNDMTPMMWWSLDLRKWGRSDIFLFFVVCVEPRLPDGYSQIFRSNVFWPSGLLDYGSATLRCKILSLPFLGLCPPHVLHPGAIQGKEAIKFCNLATLVWNPRSPHSLPRESEGG